VKKVAFGKVIEGLKHDVKAVFVVVTMSESGGWLILLQTQQCIHKVQTF